MEQIVLQSQARNQHARKRALWFVSLLLVLVVSASVWLAWMLLDASRERLIGDINHQLVNTAQERTATLTVWYGGVRSRISQFADADLLRLFATEVDRADVADLLERGKAGNDTPLAAAMESKKQASAASSAAPASRQPAQHDDPQADASTSIEQSEQDRLAAQMPLMHGLLADFTRGGFTETSLVSSSGVPYLTACSAATTGKLAAAQQSPHEHTFTAAMESAVQATLAAGIPMVFPMSAPEQDQLSLILTHPLLPPTYMAGENPKPVGVLILLYDASSVVRSATTPRGQTREGEASRLLEEVNGTLFEIRADTTPHLVPLPGWKPETNNLPLALRTLPDEGEVWARGLKIPELPWFTVQDVDAATFTALYDGQHRMIVLGTTAAGVIAILFIGMIWWWLIGRQERAVSDELKELYSAVNQQHELLRGINGTLDEGICLFDGSGRLRYANDAFAAMFGRTADALIGQDRVTVFGRELLERLLPHDQQVLDHNEPDLFTETLTLPIGRRTCQVSCSPFRDEYGSASGVVSAYRDITELVQAHERAQAMVHQTINVLVRAIEAVDPYLRGQSMHTGLLAAELARGMGLDATHAATVRAAANLSHIGMIQLPRDLITKAGALTPEERIHLERHVEYARTSLEGIDFGLPVVQAITQMHERLDGSGYPLGLAGEQISVDARLLAVANTFCALMRPRSYRTARSVRDALTLLLHEPPRYDLQIVQALYNFLASPAGAAFVTILCQVDREAEVVPTVAE